MLSRVVRPNDYVKRANLAKLPKVSMFKGSEMTPISPVQNFDEKVVRTNCMSRDDDNQDLDNEIKSLFESNGTCLCVADFDGYFVLLNDVWSEILGFSNEELMSKPFIEFVHPDDKERTIAETQALSKGGHETIAFENRYQTKVGRYLWFSWTSKSKNGKIYAAAKDITKTKENEIQLTNIQKKAKIGAWWMDARTGDTSFSEETYRIYGIPFGSKVGAEEGMKFYHPDEQERIASVVKTAISDKVSYDEEFRFITGKGKQIWVRATGYPEVDGNGVVIRLAGTFQDITEKKKLEEELRQTNEKINGIFKGAPVTIFQLQQLPSGERHFTYVSDEVDNVFGTDSKEFLSDAGVLLRAVHPKDTKDLAEHFSHSAKQMREFRWKGRIIHSSGDIRWIKVKSAPQHMPDGEILWNGIMVDITHEHMLEEKLKEKERADEHRERLMALGELAAGVGHEINNPLTVIMGLSKKVRRLVGERNICLEDIEEVIAKQNEAAGRIKKIVDGLRIFARQESEKEETAPVFQAVERAVSLVEEIYSHDGVDISVDFDTADSESSNVFVKGDGVHLQQIVINIISNAKDAFPPGQQKKSIRITHEIGTDRFLLKISDNGPGIPEAIQSRVFESFFTTKKVGEGTGLGLSLVKSMVESMGGAIRFVSSPRKGTTFFIEFVRVARALDPVSALPSTGPAVRPSHEVRMLIVDDERGVREILCDEFEELGCRVDGANSAEKGLELASANTYDVILTDMLMPGGMNGLEFLAELESQKINDKVPKYIITGGVKEVSTSDFRLGLVQGVIYKPFDSKDIEEIYRLACNRKVAA